MREGGWVGVHLLSAGMDPVSRAIRPIAVLSPVFTTMPVQVPGGV